MANQPTTIKGQLTFVGAIAGQVSVQAQPVAGNNLLFNLPNTIPNPNAVISVLSISGSTVTLGFTPPPPSSFSFSQITGTVATSQLGDVEGNGSLVQLTNGSAAPSATLAHFGVSANYAILATAGITNSGSTVIAGGNIGSDPTATETGFPPGAFVAPAAIDNADAAAALVAANAAYTYFAGLTFTSLGGVVDLSTSGVAGSNRYTPGNYSATSSMAMSTGIVLDAQGNPNAQFVFKAVSTVNLASNQSVTLINGADPANVVWLVGSAFTSVAPSTMVGNILAVSAITLGGGVLNGRAFTITAGPVTISTATAITASAGSGVIAAGDVVIYDAAGNIKSSGVLLSSLGGAAGVLSFNGRSGAVSPLSGDYSAFYVLQTTTVNGHALSSNVVVSASDLTTGTLPHAQLPTLLSGDIPDITESQVTGLVTDLAAKPKLYDQYGDLVGAAGSPPLSDNHIASGTATLAGGTSGTITLTGSAAFSDASSYAVQVSYDGAPTNPGHLYVTYIDGANFVVNSDSGTGTSNVRWTAVGF